MPWWTPPYLLGTNMLNDSAGNGFTGGGANRDIQLKVSYKGAFAEIATPYYPGQANVVSADNNQTGTLGASFAASGKYFNIELPKICAGYELNSKEINVIAGGVWQTTGIGKKDGSNATAVTLDGKSVQAWDLFFRSKIVMSNIIAKFNVGYGVNTTVLGFDYKTNDGFIAPTNNTAFSATNTPGINGSPFFSGTSIKDTTVWEASLELGYDLGYMIPQIGAAYVQAKNSTWAKEDAQTLYYVQATIPLVKDRLNFIPEFAMIDYMKSPAGIKQGNVWTAGLFVQAFF
jgi:hypothetical protein